MKILTLRIGHFGKFHNVEYSFDDGLNLIYGENESGKTTLHAFIIAMFFGIDKPRGRATKEDVYTRYQPWDSPGAYQGSMDFEHEGKNYRITRIFYQKEKSCTITELDTGREINLADGRITGLIPELTENACRNTISAGQLHVRTEAALSEEVRNYIANLSLAKTKEVNVSAALDKLNAKKKSYVNLQNTTAYERLEREKAELLEQEQRLNEYSEEQKRQEQELNILLDKRKKLIERNDYLAAKAAGNIPVLIERIGRIESARTDYEAMKDRIRLRREKAEELREGIERIDIIGDAVSKLENIIKKEKQEKDLVMTEADKDYQISEENGREAIRKLRETEAAAEISKTSEYEERCVFLTGRIRLLGRLGIVLLCTASALGIISNNRFTVGLFIAIPVFMAGVIILTYRFILNRDRKQTEGRIKAASESRVLEAEARARAIAECTDILEQARACINKKRQDALNKCTKDAEEYRSSILRSLNADTQAELEEELKVLRKNAAALDQLTSQTEEYEQDLLRMEQQIKIMQCEFEDAAMLLPELNDRKPTQVLLSDIYETRKQTLKTLSEEEEKLNSSINEKQLSIRQLDWSIDSIGDVGAALDEKEEELNKHTRIRNMAEKELSAIELAINTIKSLSDDIHNSFGLELNRVLSSMTSAVTDGIYQEARVDKNMQIEVMKGIDYVSAERLSTGTAEQLYMALRIAVSQLFFKDMPVPFMLDEVFAYYDDRRLRAAFNELIISSRERQILMFTCHTSECELLKGMGAIYNEIVL